MSKLMPCWREAFSIQKGFLYLVLCVTFIIPVLTVAAQMPHEHLVTSGSLDKARAAFSLKATARLSRYRTTLTRSYLHIY